MKIVIVSLLGPLILAIMSSDFSDESGSEGGLLEGQLEIPGTDINVPSPSRDQEALSAAHPRRSSRLVQRQLSDWPMVKILEVLYANGISAPPGLSHEELFEFLIDHVPGAIEDSEPAECPAAKSKKGKTPAKKRAQKSTYTPRKKKKLPASTPSSVQPNAELLSALSDIKSSLISMNNRLVVLESNSAGPSSCFASSGEPSTSSAELSTLPRRTLGTAVPAPSTGAPFLPPAGAIPDALRNQIIAGMQLSHSCLLLLMLALLFIY